MKTLIKNGKLLKPKQCKYDFCYICGSEDVFNDTFIWEDDTTVHITRFKSTYSFCKSHWRAVVQAHVYAGELKREDYADYDI